MLVPDGHHCTHGLLISGYSWIAQSVLASLAFACLILKRYIEPPNERRSWLVWFFDTSKQAIGASVIHFTNLFTAEILPAPNPCTVYIISFLLDSSIGIIIIYLSIRLTQKLAHKFHINYLNFGEYGFPRPHYKYWIIQCIAYVIIMAIEKIFITAILQLQFWDQVRDLLLWPIPSPQLELVIVMLIIPFIVNVFIFWVTDNILIMHRFHHSKEELVPISETNTFFAKFTKLSANSIPFFSKPKESHPIANDNDDQLIEINFESSAGGQL
ncbi:transmembrane protein 110-like protein [Dinothrombium tinctorium]|uniref:Transmembrane protein 110-like protein n=1 Tax=Dinothrombium tinctorium TaxID=1965070 RepID=A0A3S3P1L7_9ACAR|nr:transmembrane protein 110-like protein [Dinothrombium tinctorium]